MRIFYYTPFKPLTHHHLSGDLVIATELFNYLRRQGNAVHPISSLRARWIYWKLFKWPAVWYERCRVIQQIKKMGPDLWLTYHSYYKAPDLLGAYVCRHTNLPYVIFQGIYSTKRRRRLLTRPGFYLNRQALLSAAHLFTNKQRDQTNLRRIIAKERLTYLAPGIHPQDFQHDARARNDLRLAWQVGDVPVVLSAAMFRADVKTEGLAIVIQACGILYRQGYQFFLVIAGEGREAKRLQRLAEIHLPGRTQFVGKINRQDMHRFYSAGDIFAFPGINESLGMVFLEAQSCGLPVVAYDNAGVPEAVQDGHTGILVPMGDVDQFARAIGALLQDRRRRETMGAAGQAYIRQQHDLNKNYRAIVQTLGHILQRSKKHD